MFPISRFRHLNYDQKKICYFYDQKTLLNSSNWIPTQFEVNLKDNLTDTSRQLEKQFCSQILQYSAMLFFLSASNLLQLQAPLWLNLCKTGILFKCQAEIKAKKSEQELPLLHHRENETSLHISKCPCKRSNIVRIEVCTIKLELIPKLTCNSNNNQIWHQSVCCTENGPPKDCLTCRLIPGLHSLGKREVTNIRIVIW